MGSSLHWLSWKNISQYVEMFDHTSHCTKSDCIDWISGFETEWQNRRKSSVVLHDTVIDQKEESKGTAVDTLLDLVTNCFPPNLVQATMQQYKTVIMDPGKKAVEDSSTGAMIYPDDLETWKMSSTWNNSTNILGLVIFSVVTGISIGIKQFLI